MLERRIRVISEALARTVDRREFLKKAGTGVASGVTALALGSLLSTGQAHASSKGKHPLATPSCVPPGPYCNIGPGDLSGCHGGHCYHHLSNGVVVVCGIMTDFYQVGCWTTASKAGYWTCCDCQCADGSTCGCAQLATNPFTSAE